MRSEHKFIEQHKIMRLVCYKAEKHETTIQASCPFGKIQLEESCKNCVWFKIVDESKKVASVLREIELNSEAPIKAMRVGDLPKPTLEQLRNI